MEETGRAGRQEGMPSEADLADLIAALPPAPDAWVQAACELPAASATIDGIVVRALEAQAERARTLADLVGVLRDAGVEPTPQLLALLRERLSAP
jgi:hypothetical protein